MQIIDHEHQDKEQWRPGVMTRMQVSAVTGSVQLCVFQQWCDPGKGAPTHLHAVEEILTVLDGEAELWLEDERANLTKGQSMLRPQAWLPQHRHWHPARAGDPRRAHLRGLLRRPEGSLAPLGAREIGVRPLASPAAVDFDVDARGLTPNFPATRAARAQASSACG
jgi:quercetin dioxygenase-like cupin family protein